MDSHLNENVTRQPDDTLVPQDGFLFIGELAKLTATDPKTIRFYERVDLISPPRHGRFRTYLASDVRRLKNILTLRRLGVPIAQIREILDMLSPEEDVLASEKAVRHLKQHLDLLKTRQDELRTQIEKTNSALDSLVA
jgi:DNA-binding transcriptional MerR regulator